MLHHLFIINPAAGSYNRTEEYSEIIRQVREECGKGDYNNDIFYD